MSTRRERAASRATARARRLTEPGRSRGWALAFFVLLPSSSMPPSRVVVEARPQELVTGATAWRTFSPRHAARFRQLRDSSGRRWRPSTSPSSAPSSASLLALPLAVLAARNITPARPLYYAARGVIALCRAVPDLVWALLFVTAVGLGPFPGALALSVHSVGMLGRLFAEVIEDMDMGPVEALALTGASRLQVFTHAVVPTVLPSLLGIALYRLDENIRSSLVLGFVGAGGIGFQLLTAMNLFQYRTVSLLLIMTFVLVIGAERLSAALRKRIA